MDTSPEQKHNGVKLLVYFVIFIIVLSSSYLFTKNYFWAPPVTETAIKNAIERTKEREAFAKSFFNHSEQTLTALYKSAVFQRYLSSGKSPAQLSEFFRFTLAGNSNIYQIRFIDATGLEKIRFERKFNSKDITQTSVDKLQDKSQRYYFKDSKNKPAGKVWFSAFDLNIEQAEIQKPIIPTVRGMLPIQKDNQFYGILVINYEVKSFLANLMKAPLYDSILINNLGQSLIHFDKEKSWSGMFDNSFSLNVDYPQLASKITGTPFLITKSFVFRKFDLPVKGGLGLIMQLNNVYAQQEKKNRFNEELLLIAFIVIFSLILSRYVILLFNRLEAQSKKLTLANHIMNHSLNGILVTNKDNVITDVNQSFCEISGYSRDELIGNPPRFNASNIHSKKLYNDLWHDLQTNGEWSGEITNKRKDGSYYVSLVTISVFKNAAGEIANYAAIYSDITDIQETKNQLHYIAHHDALTELPNRLMFQQEVNLAILRAIRHNQKVALMFFDIDRFKQINDSFGHEQGDELLIQVTKRISNTCRNSDFIARLGGDEFAVIVENLSDTHSISQCAYKILSEFSSKFILQESLEVMVTASIGIAVYPQDGQSETDLLKNADVAMYKAKSMGGNQYQFYESSMTQDVASKLNIESSLRDAVKNNELYVVYQPKINLKTEAVCGAEALLRWKSPEIGHVSPAEFIPIAEETGLISELTDFVMSSVAQDLKKWRANNIQIESISINISMYQIEEPKFPEHLSHFIAKHAIDASYIELEVTEGVFSKDHNLVLTQLNKIRNLGFKISMDDFGTGYSSLSYLKKLPIQTLKIDKSFVEDIPEDKEDIAIIKAIIALGSSLDLNLIAEGAETKEQIEFLKANGCHEVQGFFFSKPLLPEDLEVYINNRKPQRF